MHALKPEKDFANLRLTFGTDPERFFSNLADVIYETFVSYENEIFDEIQCYAKMILSLNKNRFINLRSKYHPKLLRTNVRTHPNIYIYMSIKFSVPKIHADDTIIPVIPTSFFENFATCVERSRKTRILRCRSHLASRGNFRSSRNHRQHVTSFPCHGRNHPPFTLQAPCYHPFFHPIVHVCVHVCAREDLLYI